jgi:hypothetical protein
VRSAFTDQGNSGACPNGQGSQGKGAKGTPCDWGQRPSVILRGQYYQRDEYLNLTNQESDASTVYLTRFDEVIFTGGGVQYQQLVLHS